MVAVVGGYFVAKKDERLPVVLATTFHQASSPLVPAFLAVLLAGQRVVVGDNDELGFRPHGRSRATAATVPFPSE